MDPVSASIPLTDISKKKKRPADLEAQVQMPALKLSPLKVEAKCALQEPGSILSGGTAASKDSFEEDRSITCMDIKLIMPTVLILLFTVFIIVTVIPYAFSSVIKQLQAVWAQEESKRKWIYACFNFYKGVSTFFI